MKWCNNCEIECDDQAKVCPNCGESLLDVDNDSEEWDEVPKGEFELLTHIFDNVEADVFLSYLQANGIEVYVHYESSGPYKTLLIEPETEGTAIFVAKDQLEDAKILMDQFEYVHEPLPE